MRRLIALTLGLLMGQAALADTSPFQRNFDAVPIKVTPDQDSAIAVAGAQLAEPGTYQLGLLFDFNDGVLALRSGSQQLGYLIPLRLDAHLMGAFQLTRRLELAVDLPFTLRQTNGFNLLAEQGLVEPGVSSAGVGDLRLLGRFDPLGRALPGGILAVLTGELRAPTGDGQSFLGDRGWVLAPGVALERAFGPLRLLGNVGARFRLETQYLNLYVGNELTAGLGAVLSLPPFWKLRDPKLIVETNLATPLSRPFAFHDSDSLRTAWDALVGLRAHLSPRWSAELDAGRGVTVDGGYGREALRVIGALRYTFGGGSAAPSAPVEAEAPDLQGPDRDHDGVPNEKDICPDRAGPSELDGCPDEDGDQVPDNEDKCPKEFGPAENDGCPETGPEVELEANKIRIRGNILFETGQAKIQQQSYPLLDQVYALLKKHPEVGPVRVDGHTDNRGARGYNIDLSARRAHAVVVYLVKKGIAEKRLRAKGFGFDRPIASNDTPLGRAKNRRVEFTLIRPDAPGAEVQ